MNFLTKHFIRLVQASILLNFIITTHASSSVEIKCTYEYESWGMQSIGVIYECECKESIKVTERDTTVSNVTGRHDAFETNSDVRGIHIIGASYLPKSIEKFLPNLIGLSMEQHLKEITKNDLEPFPKLKHLWLARNQLEVIEEDLFIHNPELVYISLRQNFIKEIDILVFDNLRSLTILELDRNDCINDNAVGRYAVMRLIQKTKGKCTLANTTNTTVAPPVTIPTTMEVDIVNSPEELAENRILNEKLLFWKHFTIVLLTVIAFVTIVALGVIIKKHGGYGVTKFVSFRNS